MIVAKASTGLRSALATSSRRGAFSASSSPMMAVTARCFSTGNYANTVLGDPNTSTKISDRAIVDRISAPGTNENRKAPKHPIDYLEAHISMEQEHQRGRMFSTFNPKKSVLGDPNTSTKVSDRAIVDRISAPGTNENRKAPKQPIDYLETHVYDTKMQKPYARLFSTLNSKKSVLGDPNTSTKISDRAIIDRISAPGTNENRKAPKQPIDYLEAHISIQQENQQGRMFSTLSSKKTVLGDPNTSTKISDRAIVDRISAPGTDENRKAPKQPIDYLEAHTNVSNTQQEHHHGRMFSTLSSKKSVLGDPNTSTKISDRAIIDRISAPGTNENRKAPKQPIDYLEAHTNVSNLQQEHHRGRMFSTFNPKKTVLGDPNTSTKISDRAIIDRISAPGTNENRKAPKQPIDYLEEAAEACSKAKQG